MVLNIIYLLKLLENNMKDKRIVKNEEIILNLQKLLSDIINNTEKYDISLIEDLKSQKGLSKLSNSDFFVQPTSINTLKRVSSNVINGGFDTLENLRKECLKKLNEHYNSKKIKRTQSNENNNIEMEAIKRTNLILTNLLLNNLNSLENIRNINDIEIVKKNIDLLVTRIKNYALLDNNLSKLENSNIVYGQFGDKNEK